MYWMLQRGSQNPRRHAISAPRKNQNRGGSQIQATDDSWAIRLSWKSGSWLTWYKDRRALACPGIFLFLPPRYPTLSVWGQKVLKFWRLWKFTFQLCYWLACDWASSLTTAIFSCKHGIKLYLVPGVFKRIKLHNTLKITGVGYVFH